MTAKHHIYLISDSTGETIDRIFMALKAQFKNFKYEVHQFSFTRTENQVVKILENAKKNPDSIILYTIVDNKLAKFIHNGQMGNPCIDSHDAWMFKAPIKMTPKAKIMLGSEEKKME